MTIQVACPQCSHRQSLSDASHSGPPTCQRCGALLRLASVPALRSPIHGAPTGLGATGLGSAPMARPVQWPVRRAWLAAGLTLLVVGLVWRSGQLGAIVDGTPSRPTVAAGEVVPVRGRVVEYDQRPTSRAVVMLWPVVTGAAEKVPAADLARVADDEKVAEGLTRHVRSLGGDLAVTDPAGDYQLRVVSGDYYWLIVDSRVEPSVAKMGSRAMAELGRYLDDVPVLTRHHRTVWRQLHIRESSPLDYTWDATR